MQQICILCEQLGFSFEVNNICSTLMFSFSTIFWMCITASSGFNGTGKKKALKCNNTSSSYFVPSCLTGTSNSNAAFCIRMWICILNSTNIRNSNSFFWQPYSVYAFCCKSLYKKASTTKQVVRSLSFTLSYPVSLICEYTPVSVTGNTL